MNSLLIRCTGHGQHHHLQHASRRRVVVEATSLHASTSNLYKVLEVDQDASDQDIKAAHRQLVKKWHPDLFQEPGEQEEAHLKLQAINKAWDVLNDPVQRQAYDMQLKMVQEAETLYSASKDMGLADEQVEALKKAMERAQQALQQAIDARAHAREVQRQAQMKRKKGTETKNPAAPPVAVAEGENSSEPTQGAASPAQVQDKAAARQAQRELARQQRQERREARRSASQARAYAQWQESQAAALHLQLKQELQQPANPGGSARESSSSRSDDEQDESEVAEQVVFDEVQLYSSAGEWLREQYEGSDKRGASAFQSIFQGKQGKRGKGKSGAAQKREHVWPGEEVT